ncbi:hypothetical protein VPH35_063526 [Triticum aestivum]
MEWILRCTSHVAPRARPPIARARRDAGNRSMKLNPDMRSNTLSSSSRYASRWAHLSPTDALMTTSFIITFSMSPTLTTGPASATDRTSLAASSSRTRRNDRTRLGLSSSTAQSFRRAFQCRLSWRMSAVAYTGRSAKAASWTFMTSLAASAEESTSVGTWPRRSSMTGPCRRASLCMAWCGMAPSRRCMWPITGSAHGPGGSWFNRPAPRLSFSLSLTTMATRRMQSKV